MKPLPFTLLAVVGLGLATIEVGAETWPTKPLRAIVPVAAGSTTDIIPRVVFEQLSLQLGQNIIVENRVGAGGTIGSAFVANAEPDGYTLLAHGSALTISPALHSNAGFDPARDFCSSYTFRDLSHRSGCTAGTRLGKRCRPDRSCEGEARHT
jgi:tripartite-type tricarboxylate transporter receptor subunit TctC